eukprot:m.307239 g.307239  ORF g.307239 m.307239 type:complete len:62 (+) comp42049_c0_seq1:1095-1280(+)
MTWRSFFLSAKKLFMMKTLQSMIYLISILRRSEPSRDITTKKMDHVEFNAKATNKLQFKHP